MYLLKNLPPKRPTHSSKSKTGRDKLFCKRNLIKICVSLRRLFDFNLIIEKETLGHEQADLDYEREKLEEVNARESESLRQIFENRSQAQDELDRVDVEIKQALNKTDSLVATMSEIESQTFLTHRNQLAKVTEQIDDIENEIADTKKQCIRLESDLQQDLSRLELSPFYIQIHSLQAKLNDLSK